MTSTPHDAGPFDDEGSLSIEQLASRQGVTPLASASDLAQPDIFESDDEYEAFLADLYASRRAGIA
jgi:hypothetical protein